MEKFLKKEIGLGKKGKTVSGIAIFLFFILSILVLFLMGRKISGQIHADVENNIENISQKNAKFIEKELRNRQTLLKSIAEFLEESPTFDYELIAEKLKLYADNYDFFDIGVLTLDGKLYTASGIRRNVKDSYPYDEAIKGEEMISESFPAINGSKTRLNAITMPVRIDGEIVFILVGNYRTGELADNLNIHTRQGNGYSIVIDADGYAMIYPSYGKNKDHRKIVEYINGKIEVVPEGHTTFSYEDQTYYAQFEPLGINGWYVMTCIEEKDAFLSANEILWSVSAGMVFLWSMILVALVLLVTIYHKYQTKLHNTVFIDPLLHERNYEYLRVCFPHILREDRERMAFFALDVDKFKAYNFTYGTRNGDKLIRYIDGVFRSTLPEGRIYRHVSDQFVGILPCENQEEAKEKMTGLLDKVQADIEDRVVFPFVLSIGVCMMDGYEELQAVYSDAMAAKNTVKSSHIHQCAIYNGEMREKSVKNMELESGFKEALHNGEFQVYYQPKYDMRDGVIIGAEALVRWVKKDGTIVSPGEFIPCYERTGQIVRLDEEVLDIVCRQMKQMEEGGIRPPRVSVNFSRVHLMKPGITKKIKEKIESMGLNPSLFAFEITESALYDDGISLNEIVTEFHAMGCQVDMDDYGTGISSLNSLANTEFDVIKLDKSFIDKIGDKKMESVIRSTITLSGRLGIPLVAEGVETEEQIKCLVKWGCHLGQGFYYSRPVPAEEYKEMLWREQNTKTSRCSCGGA